MGYTTTFCNGFTFDKPVTAELRRKVNEFAGDRHDPSIKEIPGYWCQWVIGTDDNGDEALVWDEGEKFYNYVEWLEYLIERFFKPEDYVLNGEVEYQGEDSDDFGVIKVVDNVVSVVEGIHVMDLSAIDTKMLIEELNRRGFDCIRRN